MANVGTVILVTLGIIMVCSHSDESAQALGPVSPQAAKEYASDVAKATQGDPEAAYRVGQDLESGRLGGLKNLTEALKFYKLAAQEGHERAAARVAELEGQLGQSQKKQDTLHSALRGKSNSQSAR